MSSGMMWHARWSKLLIHGNMPHPHDVWSMSLPKSLPTFATFHIFPRFLRSPVISCPGPTEPAKCENDQSGQEAWQGLTCPDMGEMHKKIIKMWKQDDTHE